jgi:hypothetical protein
MTKNDHIYSIPTISNDQVDKLYNFTCKHFVVFFDLQTELVDHLANGIENQWEQNSKLSFEAALELEFKKFGIYGFSDIVEQRTQQMQKRYHKFVWLHFKDFFTIPKIIFSLSLMVSLTVILNQINTLLETIVLSSSIFLLFVVLSFSVRNSFIKSKINNKRWMMEDMITSYGGAAGFMIIPFQILFNFFKFSNNTSLYTTAFCSVFLVCCGLYVYIMLVIIPNKAKAYLSEIYPEYKMVM